MINLLFLNAGKAFYGAGRIPADFPLCGQLQPGQERGQFYHHTR